MAEKKETRDDSHSAGVARHVDAWGLGTCEFAGHVVMRIDTMMAQDLSLKDQEILYELRKQISGEISRRFPGFDLEEEAQRHA